MPAVNEFLAVYVVNERNPPFGRLAVCTVVENRGLWPLQYYDVCCDPWHFSSGELGWQMSIPHGQRPCKFYVYRLAYRSDWFQVLHLNSKL